MPKRLADGLEKRHNSVKDNYGDPIPVFKSFIFDGLVADDVPVIAILIIKA